MPIPQSRLIALLSAANDYKQAFYGLSYLVTRHAESHNDDQLRAIAREKIDYFLKEPIKTGTTIVLEQEHINRTLRYNQARRHKKEVKAREEAIPPLTTPDDNYLAEYIKECEEDLQSKSSSQKGTKS